VSLRGCKNDYFPTGGSDNDRTDKESSRDCIWNRASLRRPSAATSAVSLKSGTAQIPIIQEFSFWTLLPDISNKKVKILSYNRTK
jgi:hypothetical protein